MLTCQDCLQVSNADIPDLTRREAALEKREADVTAREAALVAREAAVSVREKKIRIALDMPEKAA